MRTQSFMAQFGERLVTNGYRILPIAPASKKPGRYVRGSWRAYPEWDRHASRPTTETEVATWSQWPDAGVGILGGTVAAIDIDVVGDGDIAMQIEQLARLRLGDTPAVRIGKAPKRMLIYRTVAPFKGIKRHPLEVLCLGQQFVAYGIHPDTNEPYAWPDDTLADLDLKSLPSIDEVGARAFLDEASAMVPEALRQRSLAGSGGHAGHAMAGTYPAVSAALAYIPNADLDYDSWIRIGLALKGALGEEGQDLFARWSAQAAKNQPEVTAKMWSGFRPNSIGAGTIYHLAMERGWRPDATLMLDGTRKPDEQHPAAALLADIEEPEGEPVAPAPKYDLAIPDGLVGDLTTYMVQTARRPQPLLSLGASLCAVGALMGRQYRTPSNLRSNLYIVGVADSGSGKNHSREVINEVFLAAGLANYLGGNKIASGAGLLTALHRHPASLFQIDEFGMFLAAAADRKRSPRHITEILDNMTELYTAAGGLFLGAEYANRDGTNDRRDIDQPCLCVYGTTTPLHFWSSLQGANVLDGSLARFIILPTENDYPAENLGSGLRSPPASLIAALQRVAERGGRPCGNLEGITSGPVTRSDPYVVPLSDEARARFAELSICITAELREARGTAFTALLARVAENAQKLALIIAVGRDPENPEISSSDAEWAIGFVRHFTSQTRVAIERFVADNETEAHHKRLKELIRAAGPAGMTKSQITRSSQWLKARDRDEILLSLMESGEVVSEGVRTKGRQGSVFRVNG